MLFKSSQALAECGAVEGDMCAFGEGAGKRIERNYYRCNPNDTNNSSLCCEKALECPAGSNPSPVGSSGYQGPTTEFFDLLNPLYTHGNDDSAALTTPGGVLTRVLQYALPMAGMILFVMLLWGGFEILAGSAGKKSLDAGKQRITAAIVGFILLFVSYWIMQILEIIFGISIV